MPELPEVENIRRQLDLELPGRRVVAAQGHPSPKFSETPLVTGAALGRVGRRGKYLIIPTDGKRELIIHLGMTGVLGLTPTGAAPRAADVRAWWSLDDGRTLELSDPRRFGRVAVVPCGDHRRLPTLAALGPEPFDEAFTPARFHADMARHRSAIKTTLLGQRVVAGLGNIYADEALWRAGVNPVVRRLGPERATRLHRAIVEVLTDAIAHGGTRLRDYRTPAGDTAGHQWHLACYGRAGCRCVRCGATLRKRVVGGRGTTWCPVCQAR